MSAENPKVGSDTPVKVFPSQKKTGWWKPWVFVLVAVAVAVGLGLAMKAGMTLEVFN